MASNLSIWSSSVKGWAAWLGPPPRSSGLRLLLDAVLFTNKNLGMPKGVYPRVRADPAERFWSKVLKTDTCWLWRAALFSTGYGQFQLDGRPHLAHRVAWSLTEGPIPDGMRCLHHCDVRRCVRPDHLFLGTDSDNMQDMVSKGRWNGYRGGRKPGVRPKRLTAASP